MSFGEQTELVVQRHLARETSRRGACDKGKARSAQAMPLRIVEPAQRSHWCRRPAMGRVLSDVVLLERFGGLLEGRERVVVQG